MVMNPRLLRPSASGFTPRSISGLALWLDASDSQSLYTTDAGPVTAVSSPLEISGCVGWWDASDAGSITASGGSVSQINDKSGLASHASQGTSGSRPTLVGNALNGRSVLRYDGGDGLTGNFASPINTGAYSVFAVCKTTSMVTNGRVFSVAAGGSDFSSGMMIPCCANASSLSQLSAFDGAAGANRGAVDGFTSYAVFSGVVGASSLTNASNGMRAASSSVTFSTAVTRFGIGTPAQGGAGGWNGDIAEVIYYSVALSDADRARVEAYLAAKWGITGVHRSVAQEIAAVNSPLELSGCAGWWDASRIDKMWNATSGGSLVADGGTVMRLDDLSGNGKHLVQAISASAPSRQDGAKNGLPALNFGGTKSLAAGAAGDWNFLHNTNGGTVIAVIKPFDTTDPQTFAYGVATNVGGATSNIGWASFFDDRVAYPRNNHVSHSVTAGVSGQTVVSQEQNNALASASDFSLLSFTPFAGSSTTAGRGGMYVSGTSVGNANTSTLASSASNSTNALTIGVAGTNSIAGFAELIVFSTVLSTTDRARVEKYLAAKWGIANVPDPTPPVGAWLDKSGNARHATQATAASRPTISATALNGKRQLGLVSQHLRGPSTAWTGSASIYWVGRTGQAANGAFVFGDGTTDQTDGFHAGWLNTLGVGAYGNGWQPGNAPRAESPSAWRNADIVAGVTLSSTEAIARVNGATTNTTSALTGSLSQAAAAQFYIGRESSGTWNNLNGSLAELLIYQPALNASQRLRLERYLAAKYGITLAPQVSNADAQDWINRVYANGGSVSASTAAAVNTLCDSLDAASLRDRFYRLNLFCGTGLNACLVPLYRGPSLGGTQYGNTTDTNVGPFVSGDYSETLGLLGSGSKWLNTGFQPQVAGLTANSIHLSVVFPSFTQGANTNVFPISMVNAAVNDRHWINVNSNTVPTTEVGVVAGGNGTVQVIDTIAAANGGVTIPGGLRSASRTSSTDLRSFLGETQRGITTTTLSSVFGTENLSVFARWNGSTTFGHFAQRMMAYSVGSGLTASQVSAFNAAISAFNSAMARNV